MARGDCGYGNEAVMLEFEERGWPYLFKLQHTTKVKTLVKAMMGRGELWQDCGDRWQALESSLKLNGWTRERRVTLVRENPARAPEAIDGKVRQGKDRAGHPPYAQVEGWDAQATPWSGKMAVLVISLDPVAFPTQAMPKQYRDRADAENNFNELKNQWGWGGCTSRKLASSQLMANLMALFYNRWNLDVRFYDEEHDRGAIRSCPMRMQGVGRQVQSGGKRTVKISVFTKSRIPSQGASPSSARSEITSDPLRKNGIPTSSER